MIVVKLMGGIGNQMFQYATARRISKTNGVQLKLDVSGFGQKQQETTPRNFELYHFNIRIDIASKKEVRHFNKFKKSNIRFFRFVYNRLFADNSIYITEKGYGFNPKILSLKDSIYLDGYWQTEKYFQDIKDTLVKEFTPKTKNLIYDEQLKTIISQNSVSIHIRRGDYATNSKLLENYGLCSLDYYQKAIKLIVEREQNPNFFIFSDDIGWVRKNLNITYPHSYVSREDIKDCEELVLMSKCKHNIIANSSFSWWSAWLNMNPNKIIVAPKKWFKKESWIPKDIIPETWLRI